MTKAFDLKKLFAEFLGTALLVLFGCGVAVFAGLGGAGNAAWIVTTALAFGLVLMILIYVIGPISGCHVNPAVSLGMAITKRISWLQFVFYSIAQIIGAIAGAALLYGITALVGVNPAAGGAIALGQNGWATGGDAIWAALIVEIVLTFVFVLTILAATGKQGAGKKAGVIIGLSLVLVHLLGIMITGTSVNPARSFGPALLAMGTAIEQVWLFIVAPLIGAAIAAIVAKFVFKTEEAGEVKAVRAEETNAIETRPTKKQ
ncbi:MAG: aquaporin [Christensenellaceae bacterium]|jgi:aquaporin Z|nr:aquaporin [Christensenellaceae bacterium]